jgi:long-subunit fatty acid transport protein
MVKLIRRLILITSLSPFSVEAAFFNFNSNLIGEQAAGMGGAYTAMSGDSSSSGFYNPASLVKLTGTDISASATLFNKYDTTYGEGLDVVDAGERVNRGFFRTIPSAIGNVYRFRKWAFGFSIVVPDYDFFAGNIADGPKEQSFLSYTDESLWSGIVGSYKASPSESFGISIYYTARSLNRSTLDRAVLSPTREIITTEEKSLTHNGIIAVLGYLWDINEKWAFGLSARSPVLTIDGQGSFYQSVTDTDNLPSQVIQLRNIKSQTYIPPRYSMGWVYRPNTRLTLALDTHFYTGFGYQDMEFESASDQIEHHNTWNASLGAEYKLKWPKVNWRMGLFTNNASIREPGFTPTNRTGDHLDMLGFSSNINFLVSDHSSYTVGGFYTGGNGVSVQRAGNQLRRMDKAHHIFSLLISTSYKF